MASAYGNGNGNNGIGIALSASLNVKKDSNNSKDDKKLIYDHTEFNKAVEVVIKILDRFDHYDRMFARE